MTTQMETIFKESTEEMQTAEAVGKKTAMILNLKPLRGTRCTEYGTQWGDKTALGLGRSIISIVDEMKGANPSQEQRNRTIEKVKELVSDLSFDVQRMSGSGAVTYAKIVSKLKTL